MSFDVLGLLIQISEMHFLRVLVVLLSCLSTLPLSAALSPVFDGKDSSRSRIAVGLVEWANRFAEVTDIQFVPGDKDRVVVVQKNGRALLVLRSKPDKRTEILNVSVLTTSELGLLGWAFHPRFAQGERKIYINYNPATGMRRTRIAEWELEGATFQAVKERVLLEVNQPYPNHNAGQLAFGADGKLYIGLGDGGFRADPHNHGQRPDSLLGKLLRIDVDTRSDKKPYGLPKDNPFLGDKSFRPEIWAWGIRNPWRFSWDSLNRMLVGDVGQDKWEEVNIVQAGKNYGWRQREAAHCFNPTKDCITSGMTDPWLEYDREDGASITGGYVYTGTKIPALKNKYVFADFVSGRLWAAALPPKGEESKTTRNFEALGRWAMQPSTFGRDSDGEIYVADFSKGAIYLLTLP